MEIAKQLLYLELNAYLKSGKCSQLDRVIEAGCIESLEDAKDILTILSSSRSQAFLSRGANFLYQISNAQYITKYKDSLTGLYNFNYLSHIKERVRHTRFQIFFFDLDNMKAINDTRGHEQGNRLIQHFSLALQNSFRNTDTIIRYGGDEFIVLAHRGNLTDNKVNDRVNESIRQLYFHLPISFSFGSAHNHEQCLMTTIKLADNAMYQMKKLRK